MKPDKRDRVILKYQYCGKQGTKKPPKEIRKTRNQHTVSIWRFSLYLKSITLHPSGTANVNSPSGKF